MNRNLILRIALSVLLLCTFEKVVAQSNDAIRIENLRDYMNFIASDKTEGRFTGSAGYEKAAGYAVKVFQNAGLNPGWGSRTGKKSYLQPVPFIRNNYGKATSITLRKEGKNKTFDHSNRNFVFLHPGVQYKKSPMAPPVFIGYGIDEPTQGWDDYAGLNVKGKWVIMQSGIPAQNSANRTFFDYFRQQYSNPDTCDSLKYEALIKHGVAGILILPDESATDNWELTCLRKYRFNYIRYAKNDLDIKMKDELIIPLILVHPSLAKELMIGQAYDPISNSGNYHSFVLAGVEIRINIDCREELVHSDNVVAIVQGTDSLLKHEYITVGAHLDHLGKIENHIYNGANDDASGCAVIMEAARTIASNPLKRSVIFVLYTSEEQNLVGSKYFVKNLPIPSDQILLNINIEQIGSIHRDYPGIWAIGDEQFKETFLKTCNPYSNVAFKFENAEAFRDELGTCDSWSYLRSGIPVVMLSSGGFSEWHSVKDKIDLIDFNHLLNATKFLYSFVAEIGNK